MNRAIRCISCGERYYIAVGVEATVCQNCEGSYDPTAQLIEDAKNIEKATARPRRKRQSVDPRNPGAEKDPA